MMGVRAGVKLTFHSGMKGRKRTDHHFTMWLASVPRHALGLTNSYLTLSYGELGTSADVLTMLVSLIKPR